MDPTLFEVPAFGRVFAVDSHGLLITIGALLGLWVSVRLGRELPYSVAERRDLALELMLVGVLGARLCFVTVFLPAYAATCRDGLDGGTIIPCTRALWLWEGGLYFHGGLLAALGWLAWRTRRPGPSMLGLADVFVPGLALAQGVGRIGCLLAGCCYGRFTTGAGLRFPEDSVAFQDLLDRGLLPHGSEETPPLFPVQIWDSTAHVVLCGILVYLLRRKLPAGRVLVAYLLGHALIRFALLPLRGDITTPGPQALVSLLFVLLAVVVLVVSRRKK